MEPLLWEGSQSREASAGDLVVRGMPSRCGGGEICLDGDAGDGLMSWRDNWDLNER